MIYRWAVIGVAVSFLAAGLQGVPTAAWAKASDKDWVSKVISVQGSVKLKRQGETGWQAVRLNDALFAGDQIRVEAKSRAAIVLKNDAVVRLDQNTTMVFTRIEQETTFIFRLLKGAANFFSRRPRSLEIVTPFVNGIVEGTEFYVRVDDEHTRIDLFEGRILARNPYGEVLLQKGEGVVASAAHAPRKQILVQPRDSVQWALYYPPVLAMGPGEPSAEFEKAAALFNQGRTSEAIEGLNQIPKEEQDARFFVYRAALLLHVGRVPEARDDLSRALALDPNHSAALALQAIIAVVQNRKKEAMAAARKAIQSDPQSATAHMALSYAHQAAFNLPEALNAGRTAVARAPEIGATHARLAELRLSMGQLDQAIEAAQKATVLDPNTAHARTILGFAYLTQVKTHKAQAAFEQAIRLDSAAPLPRLGLGLAIIRKGNLKAGRSQIEIAAGLDPLNALVRSYLGKSYFDEKRGPLDQQQLDIAKGLDPNDPTPWFYDAIRKQSCNRPGEALQDLQKSIELNDNRAVYRSRLLLDEDRAARNAAQGRIYTDLSFQEQALREGSKSLRSDPTNFSAHRLLADIYANRPRQEISQVSELLQSQLLQPINLTPVQPQLTESTLMVSESGGPQKSSFNEFNPLFTRDRVTLQLSGLSGNYNTWSTQAALAGLYKRFSISAGQFHYETEGFRPNNDLKKEISNVFVQTEMSPHASLQLEYRERDIEHGDLELNFDPNDYSDTKLVTRKEKIPRVGFHYSGNAKHHFIGSLIFNQTDYSLFQQQDGGPGPFGPIIGTEERDEEDDAYNAEGQYLYRSHSVNIIIGAGQYEQDISETVSTLVESGPVILVNNPNQEEDSDVRHANAYAYAYFRIFPEVDATLGLSTDSFRKEEIEVNQLNPKFGFNWYLNPSITIRGAAFRSLKRSLVSNQTIEPTQIAGFTQFFDDYLAADAQRYGLGLDVKITHRLTMGTELTFNDMTHPVVNSITSRVRDERHDEYHHRLYIYWLAHPQVSISSEYLIDEYKRDHEPVDVSRPHKLQTHSLPISIAWFLPGGLYAKVRGTYIDQHLEQYSSSSLPPESKSDNFTLVDIHVGYRLPKRYGTLSLSVSNLFDTDFEFQDTDFLTANEQNPAIKPERQYFFKATFRF